MSRSDGREIPFLFEATPRRPPNAMQPEMRSTHRAPFLVESTTAICINSQTWMVIVALLSFHHLRGVVSQNIGGKCLGYNPNSVVTTVTSPHPGKRSSIPLRKERCICRNIYFHWYWRDYSCPHSSLTLNN